MQKQQPSGPNISQLKRSMPNIYIKELLSHIKKLEGTLDAIKKDPNGVMAPAIAKMAEVSEQNSRLSALVAIILEDQGNLEFATSRFQELEGNKIDIRFDISTDKSTVKFYLVKEKIDESIDATKVKVEIPSPEEIAEESLVSQ